MSENAANVFIAAPKVGGAVWSAPITATLPTDAVEALGNEFVSLGFISEDGIVNAVSTDTTEVKAYGGVVVKKVTTSRSETFKLTPLEMNTHVLAEQYSEDNVVVDNEGNIAIAHNAKEKPARIYVIETVLANNMVMRDVIPMGRVTEVGEKKYKTGEPIACELTISCELDESGNTAYSYLGSIDTTSAAPSGTQQGEQGQE